LGIKQSFVFFLVPNGTVGWESVEGVEFMNFIMVFRHCQSGKSILVFRVIEQFSYWPCRVTLSRGFETGFGHFRQIVAESKSLPTSVPTVRHNESPTPLSQCQVRSRENRIPAERHHVCYAGVLGDPHPTVTLKD
jgi:hypothetical protein